MFHSKLRLLFPALVAAAIYAGSSQAGTIAHWTFNEGTAGNVASGSNSVLDSSGNNLHGTPSGGPVYTAVPGSDTGLDFSNDYVLVDDSPLFVSPSMTVEAIVSLDSFSTSTTFDLRQIVFRGDEDAGQDPFFLAIRNENIRWQIEGPTVGGTAIEAAAPGLNTFFHVAGTIDDTTGSMKLYIDGVEVASTTTTRRPTLPINPLDPCGVSIGAIEDCNPFAPPGQFFDGIIDEVRISDIALSPNQFLGATSSVPEPVTLLLIASGLIGVRFTGSRRANRIL